MKTSSVVAIELVIVSLILGTALTLTDPNLYEFCSKEFFDRITTKVVKNPAVIEFYRENKAKVGSIHKWTAFLDDEIHYDYFNISGLSYELIKGQLPSFQLDESNRCPIYVISRRLDHKTKQYNGYNLVFKLEILESGAAIVYNKGQLKSLNYRIYWFDYNIETTSIPNAEDVWMSSLLCKPSKKTIYAIGEDRSLKDGNERSQYVGIIDVKSISRLEMDRRNATPTPGRPNGFPYNLWEFDIYPTFHPLPNTSLRDFLSICPKTGIPYKTTTPGDDQEIESMTYLWIIFVVFLVLSVVLVIGIVAAFEWRN